MGEGLKGQVFMTTGRKNTDEDPLALGVEKLLRFTASMICLNIAPSRKTLFTFMPGSADFLTFKNLMLVKLV